MIQVQTVLQRVQRYLRSDQMDTDALLPMLQTRYEWLYDTVSWQTRRREFALAIVAQVESTSSDLVSIANGGSTVTSAGTPFTSAMSGRQMVVDGEVTPFFITFSTSATVTMQDGEGNAVTWQRTAASDASWRIFQTIYSLPSDCARVLHFGSDIGMQEISGGRDMLNVMDPDRMAVDSKPTHWCHGGVTVPTSSSLLRQVEVWPVPTTAMLIRGEYQREAQILTLNTIVDMPAPVLVFGTLADAYGALYARTGNDSHRQSQLFYERKTNEVINDYGPIEAARQSAPQHFGTARTPSLRGDYLTSHVPLEEFP